MAMRFGQGLIASLINPSYGRGLFTAGQGMGQLAAGIPQQVEQEQERRRNMALLESSALEAQQKAEQARQQQKGMLLGDILSAPEGLAQAAETQALKSGVLDATEVSRVESLRQNRNLVAQAQQEQQAIEQRRANLARAIAQVDPVTAEQVASGAISVDKAQSYFVDLRKEMSDPQFNPDRMFAGLDLQNPDDLDAAERIAIAHNKPSLANSIRERKKETVARSNGISASAVRQEAEAVDANYGTYENWYSTADRLEQSIENENLAGMTAIIERLVTSTAPNDIKALSEMNRFRASKSVFRRIEDFVSQGTLGELSDDTLEDFKVFAEKLKDYSSEKISNVANTIERVPGARNKQIAETIRIINSGIRDEFAGFEIVDEED